MECLEIRVNGQLRWRAGISHACLLGPILGACVDGDHPAHLMVSGMCDLSDDRTAHVYWCKELHLDDGDTVSFKFVDAKNPSEPEEIVPTDSANYIEEQKRFEEFDKTFVPDSTPKSRKYKRLAFACRLNGGGTVVAAPQGDEEHILCSVSWDKWRPDRCRIFVRTFGGPQPREHAAETEWLRSNLTVGEQLEIHVSA